jgi:hypothetical protein
MRNYPDDFEAFWQAYPRKACKVVAFKVWQKIKPDKSLQDIILKAIDEQSNTKQWQKNNGEFIPYPSTWLNQERWEDELPEIDGGGIVQTEDCDPAEAERLRIEMLKAGY